MPRLKTLVSILFAAFLVLALAAWAIARGCLGVAQDIGEMTFQARPAALDLSRIQSLAHATRSVGADVEKQILFGDLHVHTTYSFDAFMLGLPMYQGEGVHPPADACDFARFCSGLDFWSINDHAEGLTPDQWTMTKDAIRQCNLVGASRDPTVDQDMVSFLGWEWTQIGQTPSDHYGHKNVILRDLEDDRVPRRPIASRRELFPPASGSVPFGPWLRLLLIAAAPGADSRQPYNDLARFLQDRDSVSPCPEGVATRNLPAGCLESATTPTELFERLDDWAFPYLVIPHGNTWGIYTPPGSSWDRQLADHKRPGRREPLIEVFSGHGNIEEYRSWQVRNVAADGSISCPTPTANYLPECWRAGEIIEARCLNANESSEECARRASEARQNHAEAGLPGHLTVPGTETTDWLDAGQCRDCYQPAYNYRPGGSAQYALAITDFSGDKPKRFRFGFIASSDVHTARPGTGYKESNRLQMTDTGLSRFGPPPIAKAAPQPRSLPRPSDGPNTPDFERSASFFGAGGLVAVHAARRTREAIWDSLERREVYGTSGERILLWFDLIETDGADRPMGSQVATMTTPRFRARVAGALEQTPGCPQEVAQMLEPDRLQRLCGGECYSPGDQRRRIDRIEVVRIRPQITPDEDVATLIDDPWKVLPCPDASEGCVVEFDDPDYISGARDTTYYVRAIQEATPTINGDSLRCDRGPDGACRSTAPCYADDRTPAGDDCLALANERAWSSPIFLSYGNERRR